MNVVTTSTAVNVAATSAAVVVASSAAVQVSATASSSSPVVVVASSAAVVVVTTPKPTVHPDNYDAKISFLMHNGKCADAFNRLVNDTLETEISCNIALSANS